MTVEGESVRHLVLAALLLSGLADPRWAGAAIMPPRGLVDSRIRATAYNPDQVYRLRGYVGYQIDLEFEPGEIFVGLGAGDIEGLAYFAEGNHLFLKPKAAKVSTNLTVLTNRRHYHFDYGTLLQPPDADDFDVIYALRFTYPDVPSKTMQLAEAGRIDADLKLASAQRRQNFDYWYCGEEALKPVFAADDGVHTRLRFAANADLPAIFVRGEDDSESLLNYNVEDGDVVIHRIARRFVLRRGQLRGCVVNKGFTGGGVRLDSGTVAPEVERRVQGKAP
jgi:type IV secretion system protein VirB9